MPSPTRAEIWESTLHVYMKLESMTSKLIEVERNVKPEYIPPQDILGTPAKCRTNSTSRTDESFLLILTDTEGRSFISVQLKHLSQVQTIFISLPNPLELNEFAKCPVVHCLRWSTCINWWSATPHLQIRLTNAVTPDPDGTFTEIYKSLPTFNNFSLLTWAGSLSVT